MKKSKLSLKIASIVAGSLAAISVASTDSETENIDTIQQKFTVDNDKPIAVLSNKFKKPQFLVKFSDSETGETLSHVSHASHSSHVSHASHSSHYSYAG